MTFVDRLLADPPLIHGDDRAATITHGLQPDVLRFLETQAQAGLRTVETGSGLSTIVLAQGGAEHICVVPSRAETERIRAYCERLGIATDRLVFHTAPSEHVLPKLELGALDLVLIDGSHSFPQPFVDWLYTATALRIGGLVIVDDTHIWTGRVLRDFLRAEPEWELVEDWLGRTAAFRKTAEGDPDRVWIDQPFVARRSQTGRTAALRLAATLIRRGELGDLAARARRSLGR